MREVLSAGRCRGAGYRRVERRRSSVLQRVRQQEEAVRGHPAGADHMAVKGVPGSAGIGVGIDV